MTIQIIDDYVLHIRTHCLVSTDCVQVLYDKPTTVHVYVCSINIVFLQQHVSVIPVTIIRVSCNKNTIGVQITAQMCDKNHVITHVVFMLFVLLFVS
jgi:hypothetical protein